MCFGFFLLIAKTLWHNVPLKKRMLRNLHKATCFRDWCISRQLWWGHQIPMWKLQDDDGVSYNKVSAKTSNTSVIDDEGNVWVFGCDADEARRNASNLTEDGTIQNHELKRVSCLGIVI